MKGSRLTENMQMYLKTLKNPARQNFINQIANLQEEDLLRLDAELGRKLGVGTNDEMQRIVNRAKEQLPKQYEMAGIHDIRDYSQLGVDDDAPFLEDINNQVPKEPIPQSIEAKNIQQQLSQMQQSIDKLRPLAEMPHELPRNSPSQSLIGEQRQGETPKPSVAISQTDSVIEPKKRVVSASIKDLNELPGNAIAQQPQKAKQSVAFKPKPTVQGSRQLMSIQKELWEEGYYNKDGKRPPMKEVVDGIMGNSTKAAMALFDKAEKDKLTPNNNAEEDVYDDLSGAKLNYSDSATRGLDKNNFRKSTKDYDSLPLVGGINNAFKPKPTVQGSRQLMSIQKELWEEGYYNKDGKRPPMKEVVDGIMGANTKAAMALFDKAEKDKLTPNKTPLTSLGTENSGNARANDSGYNAMIMAHGGADDYEGLSNITEGDAKKIRENLNYLPVVGAVASGIDLAAAISTGDGNKINNAVGKLSAELAANYLGGKAIGYAGREIIGSKYYIDAMKKIKDKIGETAFSKVKDKINHNLAKKDNYLPEFLDDFKVSKTATPPRSYTPPVSIAKARNTLAPTTPTNYAVSPIVRKTPTTHTSTNRISSNNASQPADTPKTNIAPNTTTNVASPSDNIIKEKISETIRNTQKEFIGKELKTLGLNKADAKKHLLENGYSDVDADKMLLKTYGIPSFGNKQNVVSTTNSQTGNIPQSKPKYTIGSLADDMENGIAKLSDAPKKHVSVVMLKRKIQANKLAKESIEKQKSTVLGIDLKNNAIKAPAANVASPSDKIMGVEPIATKYTYTTPTDKLLSNNIEKTPVVRKKRVKNVLPANEPTLWDIPNTSDVPIKTLPKKVVKDKPVAKEIVAEQKDELDPLISKVGIETPKEIKSVIPAESKPTQIRIYKGVDAVNEQGQKWMQQIDKRLIKGESGVLSKAINSEDAVLSQVGKNYKAEIDRKIAFLKSHSDDTPLGIEYKNAHKNATSALKNSDLSLNDIDKIIGESISTENRKNAMILFNKKEPIPKEIMSQGIAPKAKTAVAEMPNASTVVKKKNHFSFDDITQNEKEFADRIENGIKSNNDVFGMIEKSNATPEFKEFANKYKAQKWQLEQNLEQLSKGETLMAQEAKAVLDALPTDKSFSVNEIQDAIKKNVSSRNVKFFENKVKSGGKWDEKDALDYIDASKDILSANGYETTRAHKSLLLDYDKSLSNSDKEFAKKTFTAEQKEELKSYGAYLKGAVNNLSKYRKDKKIGTSVDAILNALDTKGGNIPLSYENITKLIKEMVHPSNKKAVMDLIIKSNKQK